MSHTAYVVSTKFGKLSVTPTSANHVYVTTNPGGGRVDQLLPWTIRGKEHKFITAHLYRWSDGQFHVGEQKDNLASYHGLYADTLSSAARRLAVPVIESAINNFAIEWTTAFRDAEAESLATAIERKTEERDELLAKLTVLDREIAELVDSRSKL